MSTTAVQERQLVDTLQHHLRTEQGDLLAAAKTHLRTIAPLLPSEARLHVAQRANHTTLYITVFLVQLGEQLFHPLAFLILFAHHWTTTINRREFVLCRKLDYIGFFDVDQWPDHGLLLIIRQQLRTHGF